MLIPKIKHVLKRFRADIGKSRTKRQKALATLAWTHLPLIRTLLFLSGYGWILLLPLLQLAKNIYIDENALQPGQVDTYWSWSDVHRADNYLRDLEALRDANATSMERSSYIRDEFFKLGIAASTQSYRFDTSSGAISGRNAYAILSSPRSSGTEAIVVSASWISRTDEGAGTLNLRGISTVLALAAYLKQYSLWSKDLAFVISDGYLDGMQAWIGAYHGRRQDNLDAEPLQLTSGTIWTALNIDYPGHSFSHLGIYFEGLNGRLPNQDIINSFHIISRNTGGVPVVIYDHLDPHEHSDRMGNLHLPSWFPTFLQNDWHMQDYGYRAKNLLRHFGYQSRGRVSGIHGLLHPFRIDAFTIFALPATGPHGFHAIGRIVESTLRTANNLLERLHASFFFFLLPEPSSFTIIGLYLPSVVLISTAMMFGGLGGWVDAGWVEISGKDSSGKSWWQPRARPASQAIFIMVLTHIVGVCLFRLVVSPIYVQHKLVTFCAISFFTAFSPTLPMLLPPQPTTTNSASTASLLKVFNLCFASTVVSITSVLNFSLAALLAILLGLPLTISGPRITPLARLVQYSFYMTLASSWLFVRGGMTQAIWDWEVLGGWFAPFICVVYIPLLLQAAIVTLLPP